MPQNKRGVDLMAHALRTTYTIDYRLVKIVSDIIGYWSTNRGVRGNAVRALMPEPPTTFDGWLRLHERMNEQANHPNLRMIAKAAEHSDDKPLKNLFGQLMPGQVTTADGAWTAVRLLTVGHLREEGRLMNHCASWAHVDLCLAGSEVVYGIVGPREEDRLTLAITHRGVADLKGKCNRMMYRDEVEPVEELLAAMAKVLDLHRFVAPGPRKTACFGIPSWLDPRQTTDLGQIQPYIIDRL